ncbi:hypothetical protein J4425_00555 [Candidatus Woesearchaeota archaeon]|nr:hypothetical protein [uncultured archaeon]AQS34001.1 hypothetical protein [uncultured archaeon]MBS3150284.1 hypothetical protein [Candidatus Woesearchaeota archaeon]
MKHKSIIDIVPLASKISVVVSLLLSIGIIAAEGTSSGVVFNLIPSFGWVFVFAVFLSFIIIYPVMFIIIYLAITTITRFIK